VYQQDVRRDASHLLPPHPPDPKEEFCCPHQCFPAWDGAAGGAGRVLRRAEGLPFAAAIKTDHLGDSARWGFDMHVHDP